ncbi:hypothetical protein JAAARDRAFT_52309 [Jaapia argillacea MUCL 33604]|uniref:Uncharacterized protein n=1 Tax=Jaapia argillacea MUCL 33604 TaxID=933084 RepID=A0A067QBA9_9AGAM|nr:hypothetical protein JAAARDRAFT_52309 [Jaapia argillacea MUCL 33604]
MDKLGIVRNGLFEAEQIISKKHYPLATQLIHLVQDHIISSLTTKLALLDLLHRIWKADRNAQHFHPSLPTIAEVEDIARTAFPIVIITKQDCVDKDGTVIWGYVTPPTIASSICPPIFINELFKVYLEENPPDTFVLRQLFFAITLIHEFSHSLSLRLLGPNVKTPPETGPASGSGCGEGGWFVEQTLFGGDLWLELQKVDYQAVLGGVFSQPDNPSKFLVVTPQIAAATFNSFSTATIIPIKCPEEETPLFASPEPLPHVVRMCVTEGGKTCSPVTTPSTSSSTIGLGIIGIVGRPDSILIRTGRDHRV